MDSGTIIIDGMDLKTIPRETIRSRLVTVPQDPFLLTGSVRLNADPTGAIPDDLIIEAMSKVKLWDVLESRGGLEAEMSKEPLSQGQQQLFCLGSALLRKHRKILVLDEATSSMDLETDQRIQELLRVEFKEHTVITIAHRLETIMDSDKVALLDGGRLVEFGEPKVLLERDSAFRKLYRQL
jgi:ATP-binding cassette subfamily C (CFTR/MRP) protein 1